ncbi:phage tail tape measure protein [Mycobacterium sp. 141]|uniref:phage tail tape measure protein n=1 Tax=Mycobacterium sp. 141 TaxID=1120797 RepID=UPI000379E5BB|nr:phage tail tape measure protein [Mycobacterium sp. 141]
MSELATAWVTLAVGAQGLERDIRRVMTNATRNASITPHLNTSGMASQATSAGRDFGSKFGAAAKTAIAAGGVAAGFAGLVSQFKHVMSVGMDWTSNMNTLQAVSGATADQLEKAGDAARALGNDISLPATSANDAAAAMTELAKGGFSVEKAMAAAKGSLQLAAAAGISATEAATIQSSALQSFGLGAEAAGKTADILAGAANASSAEITDVAYALQATGSVAHGFGVSMEDTATMMALFANNGIKGSDAGTLLKSTLLALASPSDQAAKALQELAVTPFVDGKFEGLPKLLDQIHQAAKSMSQEDFANSISTAFGSDAARIMGLAAETGAAGFQQLEAAVTRTGNAADVAAAKTQGLPGAWERVKNAVESLQLKAYDVAEAPVGRFLDQMSAALGTAEDAAVGAGPRIAAAWQQIAANPTVQATGRESLALLSSLGATARELWPPLLQVGQSLGKASAALGVSSWKVLVTTLEAGVGVLNSIMPLVGGIAGFMSNHQAVVTTAVGAWLLFRTVPALLGRVTGAVRPMTTAVGTLGRTITGASGPLVPMRSRLTAIVGDFRNIGVAAQNNGQHLSTFSRFMTSVSNNSPTIRRVGDAFMGASTNVGAFTGALRAGAQPAISGVRNAASGLIGALGGPFSAALIAGGAAFAIISSQNQKAHQSIQTYQEAVRRTEKSQVNLNAALAKSRGAFDDTVKGSAVERISAISAQLEAAAGRQATFWDGLRNADHEMFSFKGFTGKNYAAVIDDQADAARGALKAIDDLKLSDQELTDVVYGSQAAFDALVTKMDAAGESNHQAADKFREARTEFMRQQQAAQNTAPGVLELATAMRTLADNTATAADKTSALKAAMDALNPARTAGDAEAAHTRAVEAAKQAETPVATTGGIGNELFRANGEINNSLINGTDLRDTLKNIADQTAAVGQTGGDMTAALQQNDAAFTDLARRYQTDMPKVKAAYDTLGGTLADASGKLSGIAKMFQDGSIPTDHPINVSTNGGQEVLDLLKGLGEKVHKDNDKTINVDAPLGEQTLQLLKTIGYEAKIQDNKLVLVKADTSQASTALNKLFGDFSTLNISPVVSPPPSGASFIGSGQSRADGAVVPMAGGGFRFIDKPQSADIYQGRGAGTIFAEQETGGEAYIPLAPSKRPRSLQILMEVARLFGLNSNADGSITVDELKAAASGISGRGYVRGGPASPDSDCSGAQSWIANMITGASGRFSTADEAQALLARGFQQGDPPAGIAAYWVGWKNGGPGGGHTAGTIIDPDGGNVNVEMGGRGGNGQYGGSAAGASEFPNRAWIALAGYGDDPTKSSSGGAPSVATKTAQARVTSAKASTQAAQNALDKADADVNKLAAEGKDTTAAEKKRDVAQQKLTAAQERQSAAETRLSESIDKDAQRADKQSRGTDGSSLGQSIVSGMLQGLGLDGSVFSNPLDWPNLKSVLALANWGGGLLKAWSNPDDDQQSDGSVGGGLAGGLGLPNLADILRPTPPNLATVGSVHQGSGAPPGPAPAGPTYDFRGAQLGVSPTEFTQKVDARQNSAWRRNTGAHR